MPNYENRIRSYVKPKKRNFKPHEMHNPHTGQVTKANTKAKHASLAAKGYGHKRVKNK
jgi:hypothetical protein